MPSDLPLAPVPRNEPARLAALREHAILDTAPEPDYDDITLLAAHVCGAPIALVSLVDEHRQWFKSRVGLAATQTPREHAFCAHAIAPDDPALLIVPDALHDQRFAGNPLVTSAPEIRFYAGAPLLTAEGHGLGTLCVIDRKPRTLAPGQVEALAALARQVSAHLDLRRRSRWLAAANEALRDLSLADPLTGLHNRRGLVLHAEQALRMAHSRTGVLPVVVFADLDGMKSINDGFGHEAGDEALRAFAGVLRATFRDTDVVARVGGDEFAVLAIDAAGEHERLAGRLQRGIDAFNATRRHPWRLSASVGFVDMPLTPGVPLDALLAEADRRMYRQKQGRRALA